MSLLKIDEAIEEISKHYQDGRLIPFIGAGFSKPLGLPTWGELIESISDEMDFESDLFLEHGSYAQLAEYVNIFDRRVWDYWIHNMGVEFDSDKASNQRKKSDAHIALAKLTWRTIYTTNYDKHIEGALDDAGVKNVTLASLEDFLEPRDPEACEVIKFHGTFEQRDTIILTESDYFDRMELESAPDQRLRSDILSNSFIFFGYSFNDPNIRYIWYKIFKLRRQQQKEEHETLRPSYIVSFGANPVQPILLDRWNINVILLDPIDKSKSTSDFLQNIH